ncbi:Uncharacterised protein [Arthrobacter agilis]|uniref:hypothetical protein n=1 Tax=Arthrobacter agilis TaxID=37921 RepID=UPI000F71F2D8|nr:hypothetical protein [Arthrobacter agilis]VDR33575.1 Uncharacterised protein [Arthrobacter agilis]
MTDDLRPVPEGGGVVALRGGVGGVRFQWEELEEAARVLEVLGTDVGAVAVALGLLDVDLGELPWRVLLLQMPGAGAGRLYEVARSELESAWISAREDAGGLHATAQRLRAGLRAYHLADDAARAATDAARSLTGAAAVAVAQAAVDRGALPVGPLDLRGRDASDVVFDGSVEGLLDRVAVIEAEGGGHFEVLAAGTRAHPVYVLVLPGTQAGRTDGAQGSNPFDVAGIAEALAEDSRFTAAAVGEALEQAGAEPGSPLIIAGYSQGGLHAMNLAGDERLGGQYDVQLVVTAGSPTGWHPTGSGEYLHLEHGADAVPELDTTVNDDHRRRTTVTLDHAVPPLGRTADGTSEPWGLGPPHKLENYRVGARLVDTSDAASLVPAAALLATAGSTGVARRYAFTAVRRPGAGGSGVGGAAMRRGNVGPTPNPRPGPRPAPGPSPSPSPAPGPSPSPSPAPGPSPSVNPGARTDAPRPGLGYAHDFDR